MNFHYSIFLIIILLIIIITITIFIALLVFIIKSLTKGQKNSETKIRNEAIRKTLGETIKDYRTNCNMTQEFVAESIGVSRQAVSKWENGTSDPSTSNLFALAKLFNISPEELLKNVSHSDKASN